MTTKPISASHGTSWIDRPPGTAHGHDRDHIARNLALTVGASAIVLAGLASVQYARTQSSTLPVSVTTSVAVPPVALRALAADAGVQSTIQVSVPAAAVRALAADTSGAVAPAMAVPAPAAGALAADRL
jgi:hypothetical protein